MSRWAGHVYPTRAGASPVLGALVLSGAIGPRDRVLEVGCGTGLDAVSLASWGIRHVTGIDLSARAIGIARRRARHHRVRATFEVCDVLDVPQRFPRGGFDVAVDTICCNNLREDEDAAYARAVAWALAPGGRLVLQGRLWKGEFAKRAGLSLTDALAPHFALRGPVHVAIPDSVDPTALVAMYLGRRNRRAPPGR